jgi:hypothetical protein
MICRVMSMSARDGAQPQLEQIGLAELPFVMSAVAPQCVASADAPASRAGANAAIDDSAGGVSEITFEDC